VGRVDPFFGYSLLVRVIVFVAVPAFALWQYLRLKRALHIFQLEGYKRGRFLQWCRSAGSRALFLSRSTEKKQLVMTGRARRILITAVVLSVGLVLGASAAAHLWLGGAPADLIAWAVVTALVFFGAPVVLVAADVLLTPVQKAINARFLGAARRKLADLDPYVVGVTGSFGKTSTKFAIAGLIGPPGTALATPGSYNTPLGVCRAINEQLDKRHAYFVVEMGAYKEGDIAELARFAKPKVGVLTAIGPAHLERFGSLENIRRAKYELIRALNEDGLAVMNVDDPAVRALADVTKHVPVVRYGLDQSFRPDVSARDVRFTGKGTEMVLIDTSGGEVDVRTKLLGRHAVGHILAAVAVAQFAGRSLDEVRDSIARLQPVEHRLQLIESPGGVTVIDDAYNSNPEGAAAAIEVLEEIDAQRRIVVSPGMIELGTTQVEANRRFGAQAARVADILIVVARVNRDAILEGALSVGNSAETVAVDSLDEAAAKLKETLKPGDAVLFENDLPDQYEG
jgi:UDP-N-acetylmuramoyl-tripeptide--D-alanyl-D-alanine ligase